MKSLRSLFTTTVIALFAITGFATEAKAQEDGRTEAVLAYNNARELAEARQFVDAIEMYREALEIAQSPDCEECEDIAGFVNEQLPRVYFQRGASAFETFRNERSIEAANQAIEYFQEAAEVADEFNSEQVSTRARGVIPQIYYNRSLVEYNEENHDQALESLQAAIDLNENYTLAYYQRGIVLNNRTNPNLDDVITAFDEAIEVGERVGDSENVGRAQRRAGSELVYRAAQSIEAEQIGQALQYLQRAENYTPNSVDLHYRFAEAYNNRGNYSQAIEHANRALELEGGSVTDRAKIYFELGLAYKGQEQIDQACDAFENAAYGDFQDPAMHELEHELECDGYAAAGGR